MVRKRGCLRTLETSKCTPGKNGKDYYFSCGKRISFEQGKKLGVSCEKSRGEFASIWFLKETLIPIDRKLVIPFRKVGTYPMDAESAIKEYGSENLILVGPKLDRGLAIFEEMRIGWGEEQWNSFIKSIYPHMIAQFKEIS